MKDLGISIESKKIPAWLIDCFVIVDDEKKRIKQEETKKQAPAVRVLIQAMQFLKGFR